MNRILGISAFYHDSAVALIEEGSVIAAAQEERFTRIKHDPAFPKKALQWLVEEYDLNAENVDAIVFYDKPFLKFERLLETYYAFSPKGLTSFISSVPVWINEKLYLKDNLIKELKSLGLWDKKKSKLQFSEHHLSHAASAFYPSGFSEAAILTVDGVGEWATASISKGSGNKIELIKELNFPHSLGLLYSAVTYFLGFKVNSGEYKLMGLAPYGRMGTEQVAAFKQKIYDTLVDVKEDGSIWLNQKYFSYATGLRMVPDKKWEQLFGVKKRDPEEDLSQDQCDLALAFQEVTEEVVYKMAQHALEICDTKNLCMAGGVALNCVANGKIQSSGLVDQFYIQPAAGDAGGAVGSALALWHQFNEQSASSQSAYLGPKFSEKEIEKCLNRNGAKWHLLSDTDLFDQTAKAIANGEVVGWYQGRMEFGPRALGNRSIIGDPRNEEMQKKLNLKIKYRESFRPFAPSVLEEDASQFFDLSVPSPYMLLVAPVKEERREAVPADYASLPMKEKLYTKRSDLQAVTHVDFSARVQTVSREQNERYYQLLQAMKAETGVGMLINTSFNVRGEPIVCTPDDAFNCFISTEMDRLVMGNYVILKSEQDDHIKNHTKGSTFKAD